MELNMNQERYIHWIVEREKCREGKEKNLPKPWSNDPILQNYRFCNVARENDKVTKWIKNNWREEHPGHEYMVLAMVVARTINWPDTLEEIGFPTYPFGEWAEQAREKMKARRERGDKVWTGAYLVSTNGHSMDKIDYIIDKVWMPIHNRFNWERLNTLETFHKGLMEFDGMGSFMAAQVVCDLKYTFVLDYADDWWTWSAIGPGSKRGLNRMHNRPLEQSIKTKQYAEEINALQYLVQQQLGMKLHAQDIQNTMCEWDKYERVLNGEGKPRSGYNGRADNG